MTKPILSQEYVCALFEYRDGELYWKHRPREEFATYKAFKSINGRCEGKRAGYLMQHGYRSVYFDDANHLVHRVVFLMHHGYLPDLLDHVDGNPLNNKIENLRPATETQNRSNTRMSRRNTSGYKGVCWSKKEKSWRARINLHKKEYTVGYFKNIEDAAKAIREARNKYHGEFARHE